LLDEKDCLICADTKPYSDFPVLLLSDDCTHLPQTCLDCVQIHIRTIMESKTWHAKVVTCPECNSPIAYNEVQLYADKATFQR
jgi:hypothetical protein